MGYQIKKNTEMVPHLYIVIYLIEMGYQFEKVAKYTVYMAYGVAHPTACDVVCLEIKKCVYVYNVVRWI